MHRCSSHYSTQSNEAPQLILGKIGTGAAGLMAIRILVEHGVSENHILFLTFLAVQNKGLSVLQNAFPNIVIVTGTLDPDLHEGFALSNEESSTTGRRVWVIRPGMGNLGALTY